MSINYCLIKEPHLPKHQSIKMYGEVEIQLHTLTSTLDGGGWSASRSGRFTLDKELWVLTGYNVWWGPEVM